jgi:hypothetical protein
LPLRDCTQCGKMVSLLRSRKLLKSYRYFTKNRDRSLSQTKGPELCSGFHMDGDHSGFTTANRPQSPASRFSLFLPCLIIGDNHQMGGRDGQHVDRRDSRQIRSRRRKAAADQQGQVLALKHGGKPWFYGIFRLFQLFRFDVAQKSFFSGTGAIPIDFFCQEVVLFSQASNCISIPFINAINSFYNCSDYAKID